MPKHLGDPIVVVPELKADRYDITAYRVTVAPDQSVDVDYDCGRTNEDASITTVGQRTRHVVAGDALDAAMATATTNIVSAVLSVAVQGGLLTSQVAALIGAAIESNPTLARDAYYAGTRDALYGLL
jgi:hypothetical protein